MKCKLQKLTGIITAFAIGFLTVFPACAATDNPAMGDTQAKYFSIAVAVLIVSLVVIIAVAVFSKKKK